MINLRSAINDPNLSQEFSIVRTYGAFKRGGWEVDASRTQTIRMRGVIVPASYRQVILLPEGDRLRQSVTVYTTQALYTTERVRTGEDRAADKLLWQGDEFKLVSVGPYTDYGFYTALAVKMDT